MPEPILSICIPTYNRADLLEICLATVLPQVAEHAERVECVIRDNASPDHTAGVIDRYEEQYPLRRHRNDENLGGLINVLNIVLEQARGEYIWLIGDDDTLNSGAVERILAFLDTQKSSAPDLVALNIGFLPQEELPLPADALGGIDAKPQQLLRKNATPSSILPFEDLFEGPCADFTAMYSFLLRRRCWQQSLGDWDPPRGNPFVCVEGTYPHACAVADCLPGRTAGIVAEPVATIYELDSSEFAWARSHPLNTLLWASALHSRFVEKGVPKKLLAPYRRHQVYRARNRLHKLLWDPAFAGGWKETLHFIWLTPGQRAPLLKLVWDSCGRSEAPRFVQKLHRLAQRIATPFARTLARFGSGPAADAIPKTK